MQTTRTNSATDGQLHSLEVAEGEVFGDLLSPGRIEAGRRLKIGLLAAGYFEYWRMYPALRAQIEQDSRVVEERLARRHAVVSSGVVDTMDAADAAGWRFRQDNIDVLVLAYRTYIPDAYVHQVFSRLPGVPLLVFASQSHGRFGCDGDHSGVMALVQSICGLRGMGPPLSGWNALPAASTMKRPTTELIGTFRSSPSAGDCAS